MMCLCSTLISVTSSLDSLSFAALSCNNCCKTQATLVLGSCRKQIFFRILLCSPDLGGVVYLLSVMSFLHYHIMTCLSDTTTLPCPLHLSNQHNLMSPPHYLMILMFHFDRPRSLFQICNTLVLCSSSIASSRGVLGLRLVHFHPVVSVGLLFHSGCPSTVMSQDSKRQINDLVLEQMSSIVKAMVWVSRMKGKCIAAWLWKYI